MEISTTLPNTENYQASSHTLRNILTALASSGLLLEKYIKSESKREKQLMHIDLIRKSTEELIKHVDSFFPQKQNQSTEKNPINTY
jgi:hypothetical protein